MGSSTNPSLRLAQTRSDDVISFYRPTKYVFEVLTPFQGFNTLGTPGELHVTPGAP